MRLTIAINLAEQTATLVEKHALSAGDTYNPLVLDFSSFDQSTLAAIGTSSLELVVYKSQSDTTVVASTNVFTKPNGQDKLRTSTLLMNQQAMLNWYNAVGAGLKEAYLVISDSTTTYASCTVPVILRPFTVGSGSNGYYTSAQVDALLAAYQKTLTATAPLSLSAAAALSIAKATASALGVVKPGSGLSIDGNGELTVQFPSADDAFDDDSDNAIANSVVATAVSGILTRLDAILKDTSGTETGRLKTVETALAEKADADDLATVATTGSYNDLTDKPTIPGTDTAMKWITGTGITGTVVPQTAYPSSGVTSAVVGDMYLNTSTGNIYQCGTAGDAATATWGYVGCIKGAKGDTGDAASTTVYASYETVAVMNASYSSDSVPPNGLVVITTGDDRGKMYRKGATAYEFVVQMKGDQGDTGRSPEWLTGTAVSGTNQVGASFTVVAHVGDMYLNTSTAGVYRCTAASASESTWAYICSVRGSDGSGPEFMSGSAITATSGSVTATVSGAKVGDIYLTNAGDLFKCTSLNEGGTSVWTFVVRLKGANGTDGDDGEDGADGSSFLHGSAITATSGSVTATVSGAKVGDIYLTNAGDLFKCTSLNEGGTSVWSFVMRMSGIAGADGTKWFYGTTVNAAGSQSISPYSPKVGDFYVNTSTRMCYVCTSETGPTWAESFSMSGADGNQFFTGMEVTAAGSVETLLIEPHVGDLYINTSTKDLFRCISVTGTNTATWSFVSNLAGVSGPSSVTEGFIPEWSTSSLLSGGYAVLTALPASAAAGASCFMTAGAIWTALNNMSSSFVHLPASHTTGYVPAWNNDESLTAGYQVRTAVRGAGTATDTCLVTEAAVRAALGSGTAIQDSGTHTENYIPQWGSGAVLKNGLELVTSVRTGSAALNTSVPTEAAVRSACTVIEQRLSNKKLDQLAAPTAGGVNLDATTTTHGLMSSADKVKLDSLVDTTTVQEIGAALADNDEVTVKDVSLTDAFKFRKFLMSRVWTYIQGKLSTFALDGLATPTDSSLLDATTTHHGLLPKLSGSTSQFLRADGAWVTPPGSTVFEGDEGEGGTQGQVPAPAAGDGSSDKFLKADGTWAVPPIQTGSEHVTIDGQTAVDALANADAFLLYDKSENAFRKVTAQNLAKFAQEFSHYDTVFIPAGAMTPLGTNGAIAEQYSFAANLTIHDILRFLNTKDTFADFDFVFPDDWDLGTIKARVLWVPYNSDGAAEQYVRFKLAARAYGDGEDMSTALGTGTNIEDQQIAVNQLHRTDASAAITVGGTPAAGKTVHFQLSREYGFNNGGSGTALGTGACVLGVEIQFRRTADFTGW